MSEQGAGTGRARGRGGRGRGKQQQQPPAPGQAPTPQPVQQAPGGAGATSAPVGRGRSRGAARQAAAQQAAQAEAAAQHAPIASSVPAEGHIGGRGVQRGGGRERPAGDGKPPIGEMDALTLEGREPYRRRLPYEKYIEREYKDPSKDPLGKTGNSVQLIGNYFQVSLPSEYLVFQYSVSFKPEIENVRMKFAMLKSVSNLLGETTCFDGGILYLRRKLEKVVTTCYVTRDHDGSQVEITFKFTDDVKPHMPQFLQIANLLFKKSQVAIEMKKIRDHYFNPELSDKVFKHKLEVMPGFTSSILKYDGGNLLGADIVHKILRMDTVLDSMYEIYHSMNSSDLNAFRAMVVKNVVGSIVMTRFNNKTYKVDDIDWEARPTDTFEKKGEAVTFIQYYKDAWNVIVNDFDQPLLISRPTDRDRRGGRDENVKLLPEVCFITGLSDQARADFNIMKDLAVHTRIGPDQRLTKLEEFVGKLNGCEKVINLLQPWQMSIEPHAVRIPARQLPAEQLIMKNQRGAPTKISYQIQEADWGRNMRNVHLLTPAHLENWIIIFPARCKPLALELKDCLARVGNGMGMRIQAPTEIEMQNDRNESYLLALRQNLNPKVQMVLTVVPNNKKDRYDAIKKICCIDNPVPSQVVLQKTIGKKQGLMSVATKIAIQMNCKMGGEVWGAEIPLKGLMVIGMDSYHDSADKGRSVGAFVASLNSQCTRYYSRTENHVTKGELMHNLTVLLTAAFRKYHEVNQALPQKVIIYRDGVGDGQLFTVFNHEWKQFQEAFTAAGGPDYKPGAAFIVVKKRIMARLFARDGNRMGNPQPGTVVDQVITKSEWYDFFLVSQSVRQGTVAPTSYNIITDNTGLAPDHLQRLSYKMTHLYFNWQGTIRVPAPCQYAHKLAFLQGQTLHREPAAVLCDKLFYL